MLKEDNVRVVLNELFKIFEKEGIECICRSTDGWNTLDLKKNFEGFVQATLKKNPDIYKKFREINFFIDLAYDFSKTKRLNERYIAFYHYYDDRLFEAEKLGVLKNFIELYENKEKIWQFPEKEYIKEFYNYSKSYIEKDKKITEVLKSFKTKKLIIPETTQVINLKVLKNYLTRSGKVTIKCKITNFNFITVLPEKIWSYYYLSLLLEEPLLIKNQKTDNFEEIKDLFIESNN